MKQQHVSTFDGGMNTDLSKHRLPANAFVDSEGIRIGWGTQDKGSVENLKGNTLIPYTLPVGSTSEVIGAVEDKQGTSIVYFLYNSVGDHQILRYWVLENRVERLLLSSGLSFDADRPINRAQIVDGKFLYWTDGKVLGNTIEGNFPCKLNMDKASMYQKALSYCLFFGDNSFTVGSEYLVTFQDLDGVDLAAEQNLYTVQIGDTVSDVVTELIAAFDALGVDASTLDDSNPGKLSVVDRTVERRIRLRSNVGHEFIWVADNHYPVQYGNFQLAIARPVPEFAPAPFYEVDTSIDTNRLYGFSFRFRYRYLFDDGEKSKWSPISYTPTNFVPASGAAIPADVINGREYNKIVLVFDDTILLDASWRGEILKTEIAVQYGADNLWRSAGAYSLDFWGVETMEFEFLNDGTYPVIASDEASDADAQALGNQDFVPLVCSSIESVVDKDGDYALITGGILEGLDLPDLRATLTANARAIPTSPSPVNGTRQANNNKTLKGGGVYDVSIIFEDDPLQRQSPSIPLGKVRIPFDQIGPGAQRYLSVAMTGSPPMWADRYRFAISQNQNQSIYFQVAAKVCQYWIIDTFDDDATVVTSHAAGDATHVGFEIKIEDIVDTSLRNFIFENTKNGGIFVPEIKDRLQIVWWNSVFGTTDPLDIEKYNFEIAGYSLTYPTTGVSLDRVTVFIDFDPNDPNFAMGAVSSDAYLIEVYRPSSSNGDGLYYELGDRYEIIDAGQDKARFQSSHDLYFGDTIVTSRRYIHSFNTGGPHEILLQNVQRPWLHPFPSDTDTVSDLGRANVADPDYKQVFDYSKIRTSGVLSPGTLVNNLSSFRGADYVRINRDFGPVMAMVLVDTVLLVVCQFKSQPVYVGKDELIDLSGASFVGRTSDVLNVADELQFDLGTLHPGTVVDDEGKVYAYDHYRGEAWRYSTGGGQVPISNYGNSNYFRDLSLTRGSTVTIAVAGLDRQRSTYWLTIVNDNPITIGFQDRNVGDQNTGKYVGRMPFIPVCYGLAGNKMVTFVDGELWLHDENDIHNNFYGVQHDAYITFAFNPSPMLVKQPMYILQEGTALWYAEDITIPATASYPDGMKSQLIENKWGLYEGQYRADFLRDQTDPSKEFLDIVDLDERRVSALLRGRQLRGEVMLIKLQLVDPTQFAILRSVLTTYFINKTKK